MKQKKKKKNGSWLPPEKHYRDLIRLRLVNFSYIHHAETNLFQIVSQLFKEQNNLLNILPPWKDETLLLIFRLLLLNCVTKNSGAYTYVYAYV